MSRILALSLHVLGAQRPVETGTTGAGAAANMNPTPVRPYPLQSADL